MPRRTYIVAFTFEMDDEATADQLAEQAAGELEDYLSDPATGWEPEGEAPEGLDDFDVAWSEAKTTPTTPEARTAHAAGEEPEAIGTAEVRILTGGRIRLYSTTPEECDDLNIPGAHLRFGAAD